MSKSVSQSAYEKIEALRKKFPNETTTALFERAGANPSAYYYHSAKKAKEKKASAPKKTKSPGYSLLTGPTEQPLPASIGGSSATGQRVVFVCVSPEQLQALMMGGAL